MSEPMFTKPKLSGLSPANKAPSRVNWEGSSKTIQKAADDTLERMSQPERAAQSLRKPLKSIAGGRK
jgi:hypothetical protein